LNSFGGRVNLETLLFGDGDRLATFVQADDDFVARFFEVQCMGMTLRSEAEDG
jgi:hypothetical protein